MDDFIPPFLCQRRDVLFLSMVSPLEIKAAHELLGQPFQGTFLKIPITRFDPEKTRIWLRHHTSHKDKYTEDKFLALSGEAIKKYNHLPEKTREYYAGQFSKDEKLLLYHGVPQVIYRGSLDIREAEFLEV